MMNMKFCFLALGLTLSVVGCAMGPAAVPNMINNAYVPEVGKTGGEWLIGGDTYQLTTTKENSNGCREGELKTLTGAADLHEKFTKLEGTKKSYSVKICPDDNGQWDVTIL